MDNKVIYQDDIRTISVNNGIITISIPSKKFKGQCILTETRLWITAIMEWVSKNRLQEVRNG